MEPTPDSNQGESSPKRRFGASRIRPRATPLPAAPAGSEALQPSRPDDSPSADDPLMADLPVDEGDGPYRTGGFGGGGIRVVGFPGCLIVSVILSLILTLVLNALL